MSNVFFISDMHFGHESFYKKFKLADGSNARPFKDANHCDETIIENWNKTVSPNDRVYVVGDISIGKRHIEKIGRCTGKKVLIKGNHDTEKLSVYAQYFEDVRGSHQFKGAVITHIPIHPESLGRWGLNIHGHLHTNNVEDTRYFNVSVEQINYTPISLEEIKKITKHNIER